MPLAVTHCFASVKKAICKIIYLTVKLTYLSDKNANRLEWLSKKLKLDIRESDLTRIICQPSS